MPVIDALVKRNDIRGIETAYVTLDRLDLSRRYDHNFDTKDGSRKIDASSPNVKRFSHYAETRISGKDRFLRW